MKLKSSKQLVAEASKVVNVISPEQARQMLDNNKPKPILVDIRDIRELKDSGRVVGSRHMARGMLEFWLDPESPYYKNVDPQVPKILFCKSNWRSVLAAKTLQDMGFDNVSTIEGGLVNMLNDGVFEIETD